MEESQQEQVYLFLFSEALQKGNGEGRSRSHKGEEFHLKRKADIAYNHTTSRAGTSAKEPTSRIHVRAVGMGSHGCWVSPKHPQCQPHCRDLQPFSFPIKEGKGRKEAPKPSPVLPSSAAASQQHGRHFTLPLPNPPNPAEGARGPFMAGLDGRNMKAETRISIIYRTFLFLSDLS